MPAVPLGNQEWTLWKINVPLLPESSPRPTRDKSGPGRRRQPLGSSFRMFHPPGQQFPPQQQGVWDPQQDTCQEDCWVSDTVEEDPEESSRSYPHQTAGRGQPGGATTFFLWLFFYRWYFILCVNLPPNSLQTTFKPRNDRLFWDIYLFSLETDHLTFWETLGHIYKTKDTHVNPGRLFSLQISLVIMSYVFCDELLVHQRFGFFVLSSFLLRHPFPCRRQKQVLRSLVF